MSLERYISGITALLITAYNRTSNYTRSRVVHKTFQPKTEAFSLKTEIETLAIPRRQDLLSIKKRLRPSRKIWRLTPSSRRFSLVILSS